MLAVKKNMLLYLDELYIGVRNRYR